MYYKGKEKIAGFMALCMLLMSMQAAAVFADTAQEIKLFVDGSKLTAAQPTISNGVLLVPMRDVCDALELEILWSNTIITVMTENSKLDEAQPLLFQFILGYKNLHTQGGAGGPTDITLSAAPRLIDGKAYIPTDFLTAMGADVNWDADSGVLRIESSAYKAQSQPSAHTYTNPAIDEVIQALKETHDQVYMHDQLSAEDSALLKEIEHDIRYAFEQEVLPEQLWENQAEVAAEIHRESDTAKSFVEDLWDNIVIALIFALQTGSDHAYIFDADMPEDQFHSRYMTLLDSIGFTSDNFFSVSFENLPNQNTMMLITFNTAQDMADCKYIGIVSTKDNALRYFTAEKTLLDGEHFMFRELTPDYATSSFVLPADKTAFVDAVKAALAQ